MKRLVCILLACTCLAFASADDYKNGIKAYEQGNTAEALEFFIAKVTNEPKHQKSVDMIKKLLPQVIDARKAKAKEYEEAGAWEKAQKEYDRLARLGKVLQNLVAYDNGQKLEFPKIDGATAQSTAKDNAAEQYYLKGVEAMKTIGNAERAVEFFKEARKFNPDYKDAKELSARALYNDATALIDERDFKGGVRILWKIRGFFPDGFSDSEQRIQSAIDSAKVKIAVMPFDDLTFKTQFGDVGATFSSEIIAATMASNPIFLDLVTRDYVFSLLSEQDFGASGRVDASTAPQIGKLIGIQVFIFGKITAITPSDPKVQEVRGESRGTINGQPAYAIWTKHTRTRAVSVSAIYQIVDVKTGRIIYSGSDTKKPQSAAQWVTCDGGNMEIIEHSVLAGTTGDVPVLPTEELTTTAIRQMSGAIAASILANYEK